MLDVCTVYTLLIGRWSTTSVRLYRLLHNSLLSDRKQTAINFIDQRVTGGRQHVTDWRLDADALRMPTVSNWHVTKRFAHSHRTLFHPGHIFPQENPPTDVSLVTSRMNKARYSLTVLKVPLNPNSINQSRIPFCSYDDAIFCCLSPRERCQYLVTGIRITLLIADNSTSN